ncbi:MAG: hypothetical protein N2595_09545 [bacterium]|nr:hypothetical protein [bacterium]
MKHTLILLAAALAVVLTGVSARTEIVLPALGTPVAVDFNSTITGILTIASGDNRPS